MLTQEAIIPAVGLISYQSVSNAVQRMKGPTHRDESTVPKLYESKIGKVKQRIAATALSAKTQNTPTTYDEAKASCKARKRKERQESISSLCQERKVIRSNSEERPAQKMYIENKNSIRRVSSSEDFQCQRSGSAERVSLSPHRGSNNDKTLVYEDCEHERRRSHERFARPLTLKSKKHPHKRLKTRYLSRTKYKPELPTDTKDYVKKSGVPQGTNPNEQESTDFDKTSNFLRLHNEERERSPSPTQILVSPVLDLTTLHEQIDSSEPVLSQSRQVSEITETMPSLSVASNRLLSSPRNSIIATHRIYLDPDIPNMNCSLDQKLQNPVDEKLQKLTKQINSLKKKLKKFEAEFEARNGYRPSHSEKTNDSEMKKLYSELSKLKKEQRQLSDISTTCALIQGDGNKIEKSSNTTLQDTVTELEKKLATKREAGNRCINIEEMTSEQLMDEKVAIQKALLYLESIHGRPNNREDRDLVRPYYDRYRMLKRMVAKISTTNPAGNELATIHENETMNFITPTTSSSQSNDTESEKTTIFSSVSTDSDTDTSIGDNLHSLPRSELIDQLKVITEEKKELKRKIKEFELDIQLKTGKMIQKEDKSPIEGIYLTYKKTKAKFKLLEALVGKTN